MTTVNFGDALSMLRAGARVTRQGWNGRGMWIGLQPGYPDGVPANAQTAKVTGLAEGTKVIVRPYLVMKTVNDELVPWVASQSDLLADDWYNVSAVPA
jgi:hypothetical protein